MLLEEHYSLPETSWFKPDYCRISSKGYQKVSFLVKKGHFYEEKDTFFVKGRL